MSFAQLGENNRKSNESLLKKKRFFDFHQDKIQKFFDKGKRKKLDKKKLTEQEMEEIRRKVESEKYRESSRKYFVLSVSFILTIIVLSLIVFIFTEYVF